MPTDRKAVRVGSPLADLNTSPSSITTITQKTTAAVAMAVSFHPLHAWQGEGGLLSARCSCNLRRDERRVGAVGFGTGGPAGSTRRMRSASRSHEGVWTGDLALKLEALSDRRETSVADPLANAPSSSEIACSSSTSSAAASSVDGAEWSTRERRSAARRACRSFLILRWARAATRGGHRWP
eukprot:4317802-Prymnesium_polylepis.1